MKIGLYPMVADILHTGHLLAIEEAKKYCDYLIVALHCNPVYKNPVQSIYERFMQLRSVKWIDEIIPYQNIDDVKTLLRSLYYDVYFLGEDYINKQFEGIEILHELNKEIYYLSRKHNLSSTYIKERLLEDDYGKTKNN
jgi:glycerol-3-phosphate cytidylyltransferase